MVLAPPHDGVVFLPSDPPRLGRFSVWAKGRRVAAIEVDGEVVPAARSDVELALRVGRAVRVAEHDALDVAVADAIDWLATLRPTDSTPPSVLAWSRVVRLALGLIARGRVVPGITVKGHDAWRVGPLDPDDLALVHDLAAALPPSAHAVVLPGDDASASTPPRVQDPVWIVTAALDAVADAFVRTAAAPVASPAAVYAPRRPSDVSKWPDWLAAVDRSLTAGARPVLRLDLPHDDDVDAMLEDGFAADDLGIQAVLMLRSNADPSLLIDSEQLWKAPDDVLARLGEDAETDLLLALRRGATVWPPLQRALDEARPSTIRLTPDESDALLEAGTTDLLAGAGFEVLWPAEILRSTLSLRAQVTAPTVQGVAGSGIDLGTLLDFRWRAQLDGADLTDQELDALAAAKRPLVRLRGRWVAADPELLRKVRERRKVRTAEVLAAAVNGTLVVDGEEVEVEVDGALLDLAARLRSMDPTRELAEPEGLVAELRPYQRRGLAWLAEMADLGLGGCLADDMGLGKTVQLIALHRHRHRPGAPALGPTLVVCPTTLLSNWEREIHRFSPGTPVRRFHGGDRHLDAVAPDEIVLATYGVVRRDRPRLAEVAWDLVVADEAQHVKNPLARTARELRQIPAHARLALTGTPVENRLTELWALLDWTTPGLLGPLEDFRRGVAIPVEHDRDPEATERFGQLVRPFLLRRRKADPDIAPDLPPKTEIDQIVPLTAEQLSLYESFAQELLEAIKKSSELSAEERRDREKVSPMQRRGLIFKLFTGLKQITNHPAHFLKEPGPIAGRSGKLAALDELLDVITDEGESALVFTQYVEMGKLLQRHLADRGIANEFLSGRVSVAKRQEMVDRFQAGEFPVFLLSLKAGGTGLNLTQATHVIHYDRWWNPAVEDQATDRAYRIGQDRPVQVHRLMSEGTIEDRIAELLARKRGLADAVVGEGEAWLSELSDEELSDLVGFGSEVTTMAAMRRGDG